LLAEDYIYARVLPIRMREGSSLVVRSKYKWRESMRLK